MQRMQRDENTSSPRGFAELLDGKLNKLPYSCIAQLPFYNQDLLPVARVMQPTVNNINLVSVV